MRACLLWMIAMGGLSAAELPVMRAKVGLPVVDELMGGCSLTCSFPWKANSGDSSRSSELSNLNDNASATAWTTARVGDKLTFKFPPNLPRELNGTPFYGIDFANGRTRPLADYSQFGRLKTLRLYHNHQPISEIHLADNWRWQKVEFPDVYLNVGDTLSIEILEIYPGKKADTAALTEIVLQGAH